MDYETIWRAIDKLAEIHGVSCSAMAKICGFDATIFNKSKRVDKYGKQRLPSLSTLHKLTTYYNISPEEFFKLGLK